MDTGDDAFDELSGGAGDLARDSQNGMPTKTGTEVGAAVAEVRGADGFLEHELNEVKAASAGCEKVGKVDAAVAEGVAGEMTAGARMMPLKPLLRGFSSPRTGMILSLPMPRKASALTCWRRFCIAGTLSASVWLAP